jgi:trk system potassium uptake protein TrkH
MNVLLSVAALLAVASLVVEYGFRRPPLGLTRDHLHAVQAGIVAFFVADRLLRLLIAPHRWAYFRENVVDFVLVAAAGVGLLAVYLVYRDPQARGAVLSAGAMYLFITQAYLLGAVLIRGVAVNIRLSDVGVPPVWLLIGSFVLIIAVGTGLLMLPVATPQQGANVNSFLNGHDALFTATSAACVTGLVVVDTGLDFTPFGQAVILVLIQAGGLGIMLFGSVAAMLMGKNLSLRHHQSLGVVLPSEQVGELGRLAVFVILLTLTIEAIGAASLYPMFAQARGPLGTPLSAAQALWFSVFHSISAFCNAGFSLYGRNLMAGVNETAWNTPLRDYWQVLGVMAPLIVLGGLGFPVLQDVLRWLGSMVCRAGNRFRYRSVTLFTAPVRRKLSLHSRVVLITSGVLLLLGAVVLLAVEEPPGPPPGVVGRTADGNAQLNDWQSTEYPQRIRRAVFQSVTARTAGFNTVDMAQLSDAGKLWMCMLMTIGGSPASTAGGMKTMTFALLLVTLWSQLRHRQEVETLRRSVAVSVIHKAVTVAVLYLLLVGTVALALSVAMRPGYAFIDLLFEACSACGTVGLSTGITPLLSTAGKYVIIVGMFAGRLGPLTLLLALTTRLRPVSYSYPSESVVIG